MDTSYKNQPQGVAYINYRNPISNGIAHLWATNIKGITRIHDSVGSRDGIFNPAISGPNYSGCIWVQASTGFVLKLDDTGTGAGASVVLGGGAGSGRCAAPKSGSNFSVFARINVANFSSGIPQMIYSSDTATAIELRLGDSGRLEIVWKNASLILTGSIVPLNKDVTVGVTYNGTDIKLYLDGKLDAQGNFYSPFAVDAQYYIGLPGIGSNLFNGSTLSYLAIWNRVLTLSEVLSLHTKGIYQLYKKRQYKVRSLTGSLEVYRPNSDIVVSGWKSTDSNYYTAINETVYNDATYITSPTIPGNNIYSIVFGLSSPLSPGNYTISVRLKSVTNTDLRVVLLDNSNAIVGISTWQKTANNYALYSLPATCTATATRVRVEVRNTIVEESTVSVPTTQYSYTLSAYAPTGVITPYSATVLPLIGTVPSGSTLRSTTDTTLRSSILSTYNDGSAAVIVVSGSKPFISGNSTITLETSQAVDTPLNTSAIDAVIASISIAFGGSYGTTSITNFSSPERIWWANERTICARYRIAPPSPGATSLEAVIDIQAYAGQAFVEITVENCKLSTTTPTKPATATTSSIVATVNGSIIKTITLPTRGTRLVGTAITPIGEWTTMGWAFTTPASPALNDSYLVYQGASGLFASYAWNLAIWNGSTWIFTAPTLGRVASIPNDWPYIWNGTSYDLAFTGNFEAFRAAQTSFWVGASDPGIRVTQLHTELQKHPLLFKCDRSSSVDMSIYAADTYTPFKPTRHRAYYMGAGGDYDSIGPLPLWGARALQSGDYRAWKAVEASDLSVLGYAVNYRSSITGLVPTFDETNGYSMNGSNNIWPENKNNSEAMQWKDSHHPATGLMGFLSRPSPTFIELAQKVALWNGMWSNFQGGGVPFDSGVFGTAYQQRSKAWDMRSLGHATFLTPNVLPWKAAGVTSIRKNFEYLDLYRLDSKAKLNITWASRPDFVESTYTVSTPNVTNVPGWQYHYMVTEWCKIASAKLVATSNQAAVDAAADWMALQPIRWVNEQPSGSWRYIPYATIIGRIGDSDTTLNSFSTWGLQRADFITDTPPSISGSWFAATDTTNNLYSLYAADNIGKFGYPAYYWAALVSAIERNVPGAQLAWSTVQAKVSNLETWRSGFAEDPRWGCVPRT